MRFSSIPILLLTIGAIATPIRDSSIENPNHVVNRNTKLSGRDLERRNDAYVKCIGACLAGLGVFGAANFIELKLRNYADCATVCGLVFLN